MKKLVLLILTLIFFASTTIFGQQKNPYKIEFKQINSKIKHVQSKFLDNKLFYQVSLPKIVQPYTPIIILLDASIHFNYVNGLVNYLSNSESGNKIDESIVIGIGSINRVEDYLYENSDNFRKAIYLELIPRIKQKYNTKGPIILIGHSNGADFIINSCSYNYSSAANAHILASPLFDTTTIQVCTNEPFQAKGKLIRTKEYLEYTEKNNIITSSFSSLKDNPIRLEHQILMDSIFHQKPSYHSEIYTKGNHLLLFQPAVSDGLIFTFTQWKFLDNSTISKLKEKQSFEQFSNAIDSIQNERLKKFNYLFHLNFEQFFELYEFVSEHFSSENTITFLKNYIDSIISNQKKSVNPDEIGFMYYVLGSEYEKINQLESTYHFYKIGWKFINKSKTLSNKSDFKNMLMDLENTLKSRKQNPE